MLVIRMTFISSKNNVMILKKPLSSILYSSILFLEELEPSDVWNLANDCGNGSIILPDAITTAIAIVLEQKFPSPPNMRYSLN